MFISYQCSRQLSKFIFFAFFFSSDRLFTNIRTDTVSLYIASACHPNPCQNDGACLRFGNQYSCQCKQGFSGNRCEGMRTLQFYFLIFGLQVCYVIISSTLQRGHCESVNEGSISFSDRVKVRKRN